MGHSRFNILIDPWFRGDQVDFFPWFSQQWHAIQSSVQSIAELNSFLERIDRITKPKATYSNAKTNEETQGGNAFIDAVLISHEFTDHCNELTLRELSPGTPVLVRDLGANSPSRYLDRSHGIPCRIILFISPVLYLNTHLDGDSGQV